MKVLQKQLYYEPMLVFIVFFILFIFQIFVNEFILLFVEKVDIYDIPSCITLYKSRVYPSFVWPT